MSRNREDEVWRLPPEVAGEDVRLGSGAGRRPPLSSSARARLQRLVAKTPEAMVKITGRARGGAEQLEAHFDYLTRRGKLAAETHHGRLITDRGGLKGLRDEWLLANAAEARAHPGPGAAQAVSLILSMPPDTPADRVEAAVRHWARATFAGTHDWLLVRHDDTDHPHVHVSIRAVGQDGRRLAPGPSDLQAWRERFAAELRRQGIEAEATPRQARGVVRKAERGVLRQIRERGVEPRVRQAERAAAEREALTAAPPEPQAWSRRLQARQESIRSAYLALAAELASGDVADRQLARDVGRFVADMPVPLTQRQAMAVRLRQVLQHRSDRPEPEATGPDTGVKRGPREEPARPDPGPRRR